MSRNTNNLTGGSIDSPLYQPWSFSTVNNAYNIDGKVRVNNSTNSTSTTTGSFVTNGGAAIGNNLYVGGKIVDADTTDSTSTVTGAIVTAGGVGIAKNLHVGQTVRSNALVSSGVTTTYLNASQMSTITAPTFAPTITSGVFMMSASYLYPVYTCNDLGNALNQLHITGQDDWSSAKFHTPDVVQQAHEIRILDPPVADPLGIDWLTNWLHPHQPSGPHTQITGMNYVSSKGSWTQLSIYDADNKYLVYPGYGLVVYASTDFQHNDLLNVPYVLNFHNETLRPVVVKPSMENKAKSIEIYFNRRLIVL